MSTLFLGLGSLSLATLVLLTGTWYLRPFLSRQFVIKRLATTKPIVVSKNSVDESTELSELLDSIARNLRLGKSLAASLHDVVEVSNCRIQVIVDLALATTRGEAFGAATKKLLSDPQPEDLAFALRTLELAATGGVGGVLAVERAAMVLRGRSANAHDRRAQAAQAMLSTKILSIAPIAVCGWLTISSAAVRHFLIFSVTGWLCVALGLGFNYAGRKWMHAIISPTAS